MSRAGASDLAGRPARDHRARPQPRVRPLGRVHDPARRRLVRRAGASCSATTRPRPSASSSRRRRPRRGDHRRPPTQSNREVEIVSYPDGPRPRPPSRPRTVDALVDVPADLSSSGEHPLRRRRPTRSLSQLVSAAVVALARAGRPGRRRRRPGGARRCPGRRRRSRRSTPQTDADEARFLFANIGAVLILDRHLLFGFTVLTGVVEEKQSRVVEVVLSTVRPRDLLMGKVLGIGILGLVQLAVFVGRGRGRGGRHRAASPCPRRRPTRSSCS